MQTMVLAKDGIAMAWINVCDIMWPIGSIYCSTSPTPPGELFGGIWTQLDNNRVLMNTTSSNKLNTTVNSGLPNITGSIGSTGGSEPKFGTLSGCFTTLSTVNYYSGTTNTGNSYTRYDGFNFNAGASNSIYGASTIVQPPAHYCYMWQRTA